MRTKNKILVGFVLLVIIVGAFVLGRNAGDSVQVNDVITEDTLPLVSLASVRELSQSVEPLRLLGEVQSQSEAVVRAEAQGRIIQLYVSEGDRVRRGDRLATIENNSQLAAVAQARAALSSAEASVDRSQTLTRVNLESAERTLAETQASAMNTLQAVVGQIDDAVRGQADTLFTNADTVNPRLLFIVSSDQQAKELLERERVEIGRILNIWESYVDNLEPDSITVDVVRQVEGYAEEVREFLSRLLATASSLESSESISFAQITSWKNTASAARSVANTVIANLASVRTSLIQAETTIEIAEEESSQASLGANSTAQASVTQAESALRSAEVSLSKTVIRAPITGLVSRLDIETGDFVSLLEVVAQVSNDDALEVVAYVTGEERVSLQEGGRVFIGKSKMPGVISQIAPTINDSTQKIEVHIVPDTDEGLIDGQSISLTLERANNDPEQMLVPLSSLKVLGGRFAVFFVNDSGAAEPLYIEVGPVVGDRVLVYEGLMLDTLIITDVRGIAEGDPVQVEAEA